MGGFKRLFDVPATQQVLTAHRHSTMRSTRGIFRFMSKPIVVQNCRQSSWKAPGKGPNRAPDPKGQKSVTRPRKAQISKSQKRKIQQRTGLQDVFEEIRG